MIKSTALSVLAIVSLVFVGACSDLTRVDSTGELPPAALAESGINADLEHASPAPRPTPTDLAEQVLAAYHDTTELAFDARVRGMGREILCHVECGFGGQHHLEVQTADGKTVYILDQSPLPDGHTRIREQNLVSDEIADYVVSEDEFPNGPWDIRQGDGLGLDPCLFGGYLHSWLGNTAHRSAFFREIVAGGSYQGRQALGHSKCYVVETGRPQRPGEEVWIDCDSGLVRRWRDQWRDRVFDYRHRVRADDPTPAELASLVANAYRRATEIEFESRVRGYGREIISRVHCWADGRHSLEVQAPGHGAIYRLDEEPLPTGDVRIREHNLVAEKTADYVLTAEEFAYGRFNPRHSAMHDLGFTGCLFGSYQQSWVGVNAHRSAFFERLIAGGSYQGTRQLGRQDCYVVATARSNRPGEEIWIDSVSGLVRRWRDDVMFDHVMDYRRVRVSWLTVQLESPDGIL